MIAHLIGIGIIGSLLIVLYRFIAGPTVWDRLLGFHAVSSRVILLLVLFSVFGKSDLSLDVAFIYTAVSFLGIMVVAKFTERGGAE
ncbi:monovalent cation/H+ antiporter complex subunit F [Candidatus Acetothermia bacterium]|nr:monovalent cation/H+ antiporter complex subunit F [Candidatus Acetothermia bacterium]